MIEQLRQLRDQLDQAIAVVGPLAPVLAAWEAVRETPGAVVTPSLVDLPAPSPAPPEADLEAVRAALETPTAPTGTPIPSDASSPAGEPAARVPDASWSKQTPEARRAYHAAYARERRAKQKAAKAGNGSLVDLEPLPDLRERPMRPQFSQTRGHDPDGEGPDPRAAILAEATKLDWLPDDEI